MPAVMKLPGPRAAIPLLFLAIGAVIATQSCVTLPDDPVLDLNDASTDVSSWVLPGDGGADSGTPADASDGGTDAVNEAGPVASLSSGSVNFQQVQCGSPAGSIGVDVTNNTGSSLTYSAVIADGGPFSIQPPNAGTLGAFASAPMLLSVALPTPPTPGALSGSLVVSVNSADGGQVFSDTVALSAQLYGAVLTTPDASVYFVPTSEDASVTQEVAIINSGTEPATIAPAINQAENWFSFAFDAGPDAAYVVGPDASVSLLVTFTPRSGQTNAVAGYLTLNATGPICQDLPRVPLYGELVGYGEDAGEDATTDSGGADAPMTDAGQDGGRPDAATDTGSPDATVDSGTTDAGLDSTSSSADASGTPDGGGADSGPDAPQAFDGAVTVDSGSIGPPR